MNEKMKLFLLLVGMSVLLAGCSGQTESGGAKPVETTPTEAGGQEEGSSYDTAKEISPPPEAADLHKMMKPILESVFGGAKLTSYFAGQWMGGEGVTLVFVLKNTIEPGKLHEVRDRVVAAGYTSVSGMMSDGVFQYQFARENKLLVVYGTVGENEIVVVWVEGQ